MNTTRENAVMLSDISGLIRSGTSFIGHGFAHLLMLFVITAALTQTAPAFAEPGIETLQIGPATKRIGLDAHFVDLRIASYGDDIAISREWIDGKWVWNKQWQAVTSRHAPGSRSQVSSETAPWYQAHNSVERYRAVFGNQVSANGQQKILRADDNASGERFELTRDELVWRDNNGNWIRYIPENPDQAGINGGPAMAGHIESYGTALYTNRIILDGQNRPHQLEDTFGNRLLTITYQGSTRLPVRIEDYSGRAVTYAYNTANQLTTVTDVRGQTWQYTYTQKGKLQATEDPNGNRTQYADDNNSVTVTTADQLKTTYQYRYDKPKDQFRRIETGPDGTVEETVYDNSPDPSSSTLRYARYINGDLVQKRLGTKHRYTLANEAGDETVYEENTLGQTTRVTHPDGTSEQWVYSADGRHRVAYINRKGVRTEWSYDSKDRVTEIRRAAGEPEQQTIRYNYPDLLTRITTRVGDAHTATAITAENFDQYGNVATVTDAGANVSTYTHNVLGQIETVIRPTGAQMTYAYDAAGNLTQKTDPLGRITAYTYDGAGNRKNATWPNHSVTEFSYNALNEQVGVTNAKNQIVTTEYDRQTRTFTFKDAKDATTQVALNAKGLPRQITDPNGNTTVQNYDAGRLASTEYPTFKQTFEYGAGAKLKRITDQYDGQQSSTQLQVDPLGQVTQQTDANSNTEQRDYDALGRLTRITDAKGGVTQLTYDTHGNLITVTDPEGRETTLEYNANNQVTAEERSPEAGQVSRRTYRYDANSNLSAEITPNGEKVVYTYNDADELTQIQFFATESETAPSKTVTLGYNDLGQLTSYNDGATSGSYTYDELGLLLTATTDYGPFAKSISYTYDAAGNIATYTNPEDVIYAYSYDANGQVRSVDIPGVGLISFSNYQWTQPTQINLPGGSVIQRQYDGLQRMKKNTLLDPAQSSLMEVLYGYDLVGNIRTQTRKNGEYAYGYDELYRLTSADYPNTDDETFGYDGVGNRTSYNGDDSWQYNQANQLTQQSDTTYQYNANGHMTQKTVAGETTYYFYNNQERLVRVEDTDNQVIAEYGYNPFGHRLWKEVGGQKTYFFYNDSGLVGEYTPAGELIKEYQYTANSTWMTNPLFQRDNGNVYFYQNDHLGTPQRVVAKSGTVVWEATYTAFGKATPSITAASNNLRLPGQYYDQETGLHHNYFRDYVPSLGRYLQADPISIDAGVNIYVYVLSSPISKSDPLGLFCIPLWDGSSQWKNIGRRKYEKKHIVQPHSFGSLGTCTWKRYYKQEQEREVYSRELCRNCRETCSGEECSWDIVEGEREKEFREVQKKEQVSNNQFITGAPGYEKGCCRNPWTGYLSCGDIYP